jgi:hypothetical protein
MKNKTQKARDAKLEKWATTAVWAPGIGHTTRGELYARNLIAKDSHTEHYSSCKVGGAYAKLKSPKTTYHLVYSEAGDVFFREVPKSFWDTVIAVDWQLVRDAFNGKHAIGNPNRGTKAEGGAEQ